MINTLVLVELVPFTEFQSLFDIVFQTWFKGLQLVDLALQNKAKFIAKSLRDRELGTLVGSVEGRSLAEESNLGFGVVGLDSMIKK